ncbi:hypothetical protein T484DRAFT_2387924 [Baffinella frigidus]|nr:hypothetical protein T484DRAFT_2387924 [Cryptophyta sp. CCMP2293]
MVENQMSLTLLKACDEFDSKINECAEVIRRQNGMIPGLGPSKSRDHSQSVLYLKVVSILDTFQPPRLPADIYYARLVQFGDQFLRSKEYRLALAECYQRFLSTPVEKRTGGKLQAQDDQMALETRTQLGMATCQFFLAMERDPEVRQAATVDVVVQQLCQVRKTCVEVSGQGQENYWLIYNGSISIFTLCSPLIAFGYAQLAVEFLLFAALSMEAQVPLNQAKYVLWRVRLYAAVCLAYEESKMRPEALAFAERGLKEVQRLQAAEALDPVPPPADMKRKMAAAELEMLVNVLRCKTTTGGADALKQITEAARDGFVATLRSVIHVCEDSQRRTLRHLKPTENEKCKAELLVAMVATMQPKLELMCNFVEPPAPREGEAEKEPVTEDQYRAAAEEVPLAETTELLKYAYNLELWPQFTLLLDAVRARLLVEDQEGSSFGAQVNLLGALYSLEYPEDRPPPSAAPHLLACDGETDEQRGVRRKLVGLGRVAQVLWDLQQAHPPPEWEPEAASGPDLFADGALLIWTHTEALLQVYP